MKPPFVAGASFLAASFFTGTSAQQWWRLGPSVSTFQVPSVAHNNSVDEDAARLSPIELSMYLDLDYPDNAFGLILVQIDGSEYPINIKRDSARSSMEIADEFILQFPHLSGDARAAIADEIDAVRQGFSEQGKVLVSSASRPDEIIIKAKEVCMVYGAPLENVNSCFANVLENLQLRVDALRWQAACKARGLQHTFDPPFFDHWHDRSGRSNAVLFHGLLLGGFKTDPIFQKTKLDIHGGRPLRLLEVGSFEGSSATWMAQHLLLHHPESLLLCIDNWSEANYIDIADNHLEVEMAASLRGDDSALERFKSNLGKTPGGSQVVGVRASESGLALLALLGRAPAEEVESAFDLVFIDGGHGSHEVLQDAVLCWRMLKPGGVLIFDDYGGNATLTRTGIDAFLGAYRPFLTVVLESYLLVAVKNVGDTPTSTSSNDDDTTNAAGMAAGVS